VEEEITMYAETNSNAAFTAWGYRHPHLSTGVRVAAGAWNLAVGIILLAHGYRWWGLLELAVSALIFCAAYILARRHSEARRNGQN
jgi:hypothetical protein